MNKFYKEIDKVLVEYEENKPYHSRGMSWVSDRIEWCWKWRKITRDQMEELADRATAIFNEGNFKYI